MPTKPLTKRPLDLLYFWFFLMHIPPTLLLDIQYIFKLSWLPSVISNLPHQYVAMSQDPLMGSASGILASPENVLWFKPFLYLEVFFQLPVFIFGAWGLLRGSKAVYVLILAYGASTATTLLPCLAIILATPLTSSETIATKTLSVTPEQRSMLLSSYGPFFAIPLFMTIDMSFRIVSLLRAGERAQHVMKTR